ncbi:hypothetical protein NPJ88_007035 [Halomonas elongata]|uniref:hypothetical protein n=1 Tax=Halomonas elongata TaxID=2746 RepID=UPI00255ADFE6|nr:hypothetical protein [Halomonas elongata]MDL4862081.1 hypothetical protein [Halomonas elongata]
MQRRPEVSDDMIQVAAEEVAKKLNIADGAEDIANEYRYPMDGFDLAVELSKWCHWDLDRNDADVLDEMDMLVRYAHEAACRQWFEENDIQPPFPVGTEIAEGVIEGIDEHGVARYLVRQHKTPPEEKRWLLVNFEDAKLPAAA